MNPAGIQERGDYRKELWNGRRGEKREREQAKQLTDERNPGDEAVFLSASTKTVVKRPGEREVEI